MTQPFDKARASLNRTPLDDRQLLSGAYWAELRTFLAVAKSKSFNRAAQTLNISQPNVSRQVRRLQDLIGSQLLLPTATGVVLTDKGQQLAEMLLKFDEQLFAVSRSLGAEAREAEGLVRFSSTEGLAGLFVAPQLPEFISRFPKIHLHIKNIINMTSFDENQSDIVLGFGESTQPGIASRPLGYVHLIAVASEPYFSRYGIPTQNNLENHRFVDAEYYSSQNPTWSSWQTALARGTAAQKCDNSFAYALMIKEGIGIGLLPSYTLADPTFVPLDVGVHVKLPLHLNALSERLQSRPVSVVYNWLSDILSVDNPWFGEMLNLDGVPRGLLSETMRHILLSDLPR